MSLPRFGANYVPSQQWFYSWLDYSGDAVRRDFEDLAGLGLDHVRVFPIWPWIQPNRSLLRSRAIEDLLGTIDAAAEFGLEVAVDLVQGHLSSFDFLPSWVLTWHQRSIFEDPTGLDYYVSELTRAVASRDNVFAVTLGNEVNNLWPTNSTSPQASSSWARDLIAIAREAAPELLVLHSLYDAAWYSPDHPFSATDAVDLGDLTTVHSWVFNGVSALDGPLGPATVSHADYLVSVAAAMSRDPDRPVWLQEIGAPLPDIPVDVAPEFTHRTLELVLPNPALWGVTWWCSHDIDRSLADFPDREYDLGLFTTDHQRKPLAQALADVIAGARPDPRPATEPDIDLRTTAPDLAPGSDFHKTWLHHRFSRP